MNDVVFFLILVKILQFWKFCLKKMEENFLVADYITVSPIFFLVFSLDSTEKHNYVVVPCTYMKKISEMNKPFMSSWNICPKACCIKGGRG